MTSTTRTWSMSLASLLLAAAQAQATTLTFETRATGTTLSTQYASLGATFSANAFSGAGSSTSGQPWATNTDMTIVSSTGSDVGGLGTPAGLVSGNVLRSFNGWFGENGDPSFRITFSGPVTGFSAAFAGVAEPADVTIWGYNGATLLGQSASTVTTGQFVLSFPGTVTSVVIRPGSFFDWVGVDNITYTLSAVPEASSVALMGLGVMTLLAVRRPRAG